MSSDELLVQALKIDNLPVKYYEYEGKEPAYIVYNEEAEQLVNFGDNAPLNNVIWWQVHIFSPKTYDFRGTKKSITKSLREAGFLITDTATLYEKETKTIHVVISCHMGESEE